MSHEYTAGMINIGKDEIRYRRLTQGWGGLVLAIAVLVILYFFNFSFPAYLFLFIPIYISFTGFYQAHEKFCIAYAKNGVCNISGQTGETRDVIGRLNRIKDNQRANRMIAVSLFGSGVATVLIAVISSL